MDDRPIGVFDSGFGGLTVARALIDLLPDEAIVYVGDSARYPYGSRTSEEIRRYSGEIAEYLCEVADVKLIVVACNSAASASLDELRYRFDLPIVGVIEPGLRAAAKVTQNGRVGVIGTEATIRSGAYPKLAESLRLGIAPLCVACPGFVEYVERGETTGEEVHRLVESRLAPLRDAEIDTLLLGCTHYPFLARTISDVIGTDVVLVSSADETAFEVRALLDATGLRSRLPSKGEHRFLSSGDVGWFSEMGRRFLGPELSSAEPVDFANSAAASDVPDPTRSGDDDG
jgi:glutamate racemase